MRWILNEQIQTIKNTFAAKNYELQTAQVLLLLC